MEINELCVGGDVHGWTFGHRHWHLPQSRWQSPSLQCHGQHFKNVGHSPLCSKRQVLLNDLRLSGADVWRSLWDTVTTLRRISFAVAGHLTVATSPVAAPTAWCTSGKWNLEISSTGPISRSSPKECADCRVTLEVLIKSSSIPKKTSLAVPPRIRRSILEI